MYKNIEKNKVIQLVNELPYEKGQVISKTLVQNDKVSVTLFSFAEGEEISSHKSDGDAMVTILDGEAKIMIDYQYYRLSAGETIVMPKGIAHALFAVKPFKMILTVSF